MATLTSKYLGSVSPKILISMIVQFSLFRRRFLNLSWRRNIPSIVRKLRRRTRKVNKYGISEISEFLYRFDVFSAAEQKAKLKTYTEVRKQREEFRQRLVKLITCKEDDMDIDPADIPSAEEREMLRYYYYIRYGVDTIYVAPIDNLVLKRVCASMIYVAQ